MSGEAMKTYLNVPYAEKDAAKRMGARFDMSCKRWYVPDGTHWAPFKKWIFGKPPPSFEARKREAIRLHQEGRAAGANTR